jgi:hypothetical protein
VGYNKLLFHERYVDCFMSPIPSGPIRQRLGLGTEAVHQRELCQGALLFGYEQSVAASNNRQQQRKQSGHMFTVHYLVVFEHF